MNEIQIRVLVDGEDISRHVSSVGVNENVNSYPTGSFSLKNPNSIYTKETTTSPIFDRSSVQIYVRGSSADSWTQLISGVVAGPTYNVNAVGTTDELTVSFVGGGALHKAMLNPNSIVTRSTEKISNVFKGNPTDGEGYPWAADACGNYPDGFLYRTGYSYSAHSVDDLFPGVDDFPEHYPQRSRSIFDAIKDVCSVYDLLFYINDIDMELTVLRAPTVDPASFPVSTFEIEYGLNMGAVFVEADQRDRYDKVTVIGASNHWSVGDGPKEYVYVDEELLSMRTVIEKATNLAAIHLRVTDSPIYHATKINVPGITESIMLKRIKVTDPRLGLDETWRNVMGLTHNISVDRWTTDIRLERRSLTTGKILAEILEDMERDEMEYFEGVAPLHGEPEKDPATPANLAGATVLSNLFSRPYYNDPWTTAAPSVEISKNISYITFDGIAEYELEPTYLPGEHKGMWLYRESEATMWVTVESGSAADKIIFEDDKVPTATTMERVYLDYSDPSSEVGTFDRSNVTKIIIEHKSGGGNETKLYRIDLDYIDTDTMYPMNVRRFTEHYEDAGTMYTRYDVSTSMYPENLHTVGVIYNDLDDVGENERGNDVYISNWVSESRAVENMRGFNHVLIGSIEDDFPLAITSATIESAGQEEDPFYYQHIPAVDFERVLITDCESGGDCDPGFMGPNDSHWYRDGRHARASNIDTAIISTLDGRALRVPETFEGYSSVMGVMVGFKPRVESSLLDKIQSFTFTMVTDSNRLHVLMYNNDSGCWDFIPGAASWWDATGPEWELDGFYAFTMDLAESTYDYMDDSGNVFLLIFNIPVTQEPLDILYMSAGFVFNREDMYTNKNVSILEQCWAYNVSSERIMNRIVSRISLFAPNRYDVHVKFRTEHPIHGISNVFDTATPDSESHGFVSPRNPVDADIEIIDERRFELIFRNVHFTDRMKIERKYINVTTDMNIPVYLLYLARTQVELQTPPAQVIPASSFIIRDPAETERFFDGISTRVEGMNFVHPGEDWGGIGSDDFRIEADILIHGSMPNDELGMIVGATRMMFYVGGDMSLRFTYVHRKDYYPYEIETSTRTTPSNSLSRNIWYRVGVERSGNDLHFYIDDMVTPFHSTDMTKKMLITGPTPTIGVGKHDGPEYRDYFRGQIKNVTFEVDGTTMIWDLTLLDPRGSAAVNTEGDDGTYYNDTRRSGKVVWMRMDRHLPTAGFPIRVEYNYLGGEIGSWLRVLDTSRINQGIDMSVTKTASMVLKLDPAETGTSVVNIEGVGVDTPSTYPPSP